MTISLDGVTGRSGRGASVLRRAQKVAPAPFANQENIRYFGFLGAVLALGLALFVGFSLYEWSRLGETQLGMRKPPILTSYYAGRFATAILLSLVIAIGLYSLRGIGSVIEQKRMLSYKRRVAWVLLALAMASTVLFVQDAQLFNRLALEDRPLEWISALLPLVASIGFCIAFVQAKRAPQRDLRRRLNLIFCALFAFGLFVIGMEEISWMQRVFAISTPALFAENQQQEMNLHNMHSIVIGQTYKIAMFVGLVLLPFLADTAPRNRLFELISDFLPSRFILALSAPWVAFNYNEWNFLASQLFVTLTLAILACYIKAASDRRDLREMVLFVAIAVFIVVAQPIFLALGDRFVRMWDASEYVEFFIALGLSFYCAETMTRLAARYRAAKP
jgi:hypothetical protein